MSRALAVLACLAVAPSLAVAADDGVWNSHPDYPKEQAFVVWVYDPVHDRAVLTTGPVGQDIDVTWTLGFRGETDWDPVPSANDPGFHFATVYGYDPLRRRIVVTTGTPTWALELDPVGPNHWTQLTPSGTAPIARRYAAGFHDSFRDRLVMFGGQEACPGCETPFNDVHALDLAGGGVWSSVGVSGTAPSPRYGHTAIHDRLRDRAVLFGGTDDGTLFNDVWAIDFTGPPHWTNVATTGTPPPGLMHASAMWDSAGDQMVVFGGQRGLASQATNATWVLDLATFTWDSVEVAAPLPARAGHRVFHDPVDDRMVVHAGLAPSAIDDVWALDLRGTPQWTQLSGASPEPWMIVNHSMIHDASRERLLVYGPSFGGNAFFSWSLEDDDWTTLPIPPAGTRQDHVAILDPLRDRMIVHGGTRPTNTVLGDLWEYSMATSTWTEIVPTGTVPSPRFGHVAIHDPVRDRMIVHGGTLDASKTYALDLATHQWSEIVTPTSPGPRRGHAGAYDVARDRLLIYGRNGSAKETWALTLSGTPEWQLLATGGPHTPDDCTAIVDWRRDRFVVLTGGTGSESTNPYALNLSGPPAWTLLAPTGSIPGRSKHAALYDEARDRMVIYGGSRSTSFFTEFRPDVYTLDWSPNGVVEVPAPVPASIPLLGSIRPNPARGALTIELALPDAGHATVEVLGVDGRRVWSRRVSGTQRISWDGRDRFQRAVDPGVYWVVVRTAAGQRDSRRIVQLH